MEKDLIEQNKQDFITIAKTNIKRDGIDELLKYLESTDFFTAPASSRYHLCEEGGLCAHSLNVYYRLEQLCLTEYGESGYNPETVAIIALFHDICKANFYKTDYRNVKEDGVWVQKPYYTIEDALPYGHGEKSVYIVNGFMRLTREEAMAINWHMGLADKRAVGGDTTYSVAFKKYPMAFLVHIADMEATYLDETDLDN